MKILYKKYVLIVKINNNVEKIFFDNVINYKTRSVDDCGMQEEYMAVMAVCNSDAHDQMCKLSCQSYLNNNIIIS